VWTGLQRGLVAALRGDQDHVGTRREVYRLRRDALVGTLRAAGAEIDAPEGTFVYAEPGTRRGAHALEAGTAIVAFGAKRGVPHEISAWEDIFVAFGHLRNGDEEAGRRAMQEVLAEKPDVWQGHYNAACFEAQTGHKDAAIAHLKRAIELEPEAAREAAATDPDFDPYRDDPEFSAVAGQADASSAPS
jgi:hypothetical protein